MIKSLKSEALVLKKKSILGKDTIVTLFTRELGKMTVLAKGIKKITSRRLPHIQTGNLIHVFLNKHHERYYLQETQLISHFSQIKNNKEKLNNLYFFLYILDRLLPEGQIELPIYILMKKFLINLAKTKDFPKDKLRDYLNQLLQQLGYTHQSISLEDIKRTVETITNEPFSSLNL